MKKCYIESRKKETSYKQYNEGELTPLVASCVGTRLLKQPIELKIEGRIEGKRRRGRRRKHILENPNEKRGY
jgi:hypothetical protein